MTEPTPPPLQAPTAKERKYDRQLRLWAAQGQKALEEAHVLLINSGSGVVGVEALKNLVLPGIGQFTILDPAIVTEADLGVNFFLEDEDLGKFRAESCTRWLQELNPDVNGHHLSEPYETFFSREASLLPFTLILVTLPLDPEIVEIISTHALNTGVPVFYLHCLGFYSHFTIQLPPTFPIVDTHPDPATTEDLRLLKPWDSLIALTEEQTRDLDQMEDDEHGHVPYVLLLLHYLSLWKIAHSGAVPQNYKEKSEFRDMVRSGARTKNAEGGEENFDEAVANVLKSLNPPNPSSAVKEVFSAEECQNISSNSTNFWVIAHAVHQFYQSHSQLPLSGSLPDMKAKSADYIRLQNVYKSKARADFQEVLERVQKLNHALDRKIAVDAKEVEAFCKAAGHIRLVRGRTPHISKPQTHIHWEDRAKSALNSLTNPESLLPVYIAFQAYDSYAASHDMEGKVGKQQQDVEPDDDLEVEAGKMIGIAHKMIDDLIKEAEGYVEEPEYSEILEKTGKVVQELVRAGGSELHNIAALTGGVIAQEAIKVITQQYVPVDNTCLFDGISSKTSVIRV